jgi:hypothetical protein
MGQQESFELVSITLHTFLFINQYYESNSKSDLNFIFSIVSTKKGALNLYNISLRCHHRIAHMIEGISFHF